jgi:hypothetical protein
MEVAYKPVRLSWSRLRVHDECPAKGDLIARKMKGPITDVRNFFHGNVCDLAMRRFLALEDPASEMGWMAAQVDALFDESLEIAKSTGDGVVKWKHPGDRDETREFCRQCVTQLEPLLAKYCLPFDWSPGWRFKVPLKVHYGQEIRQITLTGEIDLLVFDGQGRVWIWDLKATKNNEYYRKVLGQLAFYAIAVKASDADRLGQWPVMAGLLQPMCDTPDLRVDIMKDGQAIREMASRIERVAGDIWAGRLDPKPTDWCNRCEVINACPAFSPAQGSKISLVA